MRKKSDHQEFWQLGGIRCEFCQRHMRCIFAEYTNAGIIRLCWTCTRQLNKPCKRSQIFKANMKRWLKQYNNKIQSVQR